MNDKLITNRKKTAMKHQINLSESYRSHLSPKKRPDGLTALCILSFAGSGAACIMYLYATLFFDNVSSFIISYSSWHSTENISPVYFGILTMIYAVSFAGVSLIWKLRKNGLMIYTAAQLSQLFLPSLWINFQAFSISNAIFTGVFLGGYLFYSRKLF